MIDYIVYFLCIKGELVINYFISFGFSFCICLHHLQVILKPFIFFLFLICPFPHLLLFFLFFVITSYCLKFSENEVGYIISLILLLMPHENNSSFLLLTVLISISTGVPNHSASIQVPDVLYFYLYFCICLFCF